MSWFVLTRNGDYLNPDHVRQVRFNKDGKYHYAVTAEDDEIPITAPETIIRQVIPCSEATLCVAAYRDQHGLWCTVETPMIGWALMVTGDIKPILISDLDVVVGDEWALRKAGSQRVWLPFEACYESIEHWLEMLRERDAAQASAEEAEEPAA